MKIRKIHESIRLKIIVAMPFYESISHHYDAIFPLNKKQLSFIENIGFNSDATVLDIGCSTGNLTSRVAELYPNSTGIDLDEEMIALAKERDSKAAFTQGNILNLQEIFSTKRFDLVFCFGNTIPHLDGPGEILTFLKQTYHLMNRSGKLLIQIINYDRILDQNIDSLPTIENEAILFKRNYSYAEKEHKIIFETALTIKSEQRTIENTILLYPLRKLEIIKLLQKTGFQNIEILGSFDRAPFSETSIPLILSAEK